MGSVTLKHVNGVLDSIHFESYEDFINYENGAVPTPASPPENKTNIYLTEDEIYTLRILLGHVIDKECNSIAEKLELLDDYELDCDDYDMMYFTKSSDFGKIEILEDLEKEITIRFKEEE